MKSIKCILVLWLFLLWFFINQSYAYKLRNFWVPWQWWSISTWQPQELKMWVDSHYVWYLAYSYWTTFWSWEDQWYFSVCWNFWQVFSWRPWYDWSIGWSVNGIYAEDDWAWGINLYRCSPQQKQSVLFNIPSKAWMLMDFGWQQQLLDSIYVWHNSLILQSSTTYDTLQIVGDYWYQNKVFYCDPQDETQNFYMIDFKQGKAWSTHTTRNSCFAYMLWEIHLSQTFLNNVGWQYSYTLSPWGQYFFPQTVWYKNWFLYSQKSYTDYEQWLISNNLWRVYSQDIVYEAPNYNFNGWTWTWSAIIIDDTNNQVSQDYNECVNTYSYYNAIANSRNGCRSDYSNWKLTPEQFSEISQYVQSLDDIIWNRSWSYPVYTWSLNCTLLVENARSYAKNEIIDKNAPRSDYHVAIQDIKLKIWNNPYDIQALCWNKPTSTNQDNECSLTSWSWIVNCFWGWTQASSWTNWNSLFISAVDNIKLMIGWTFDDNFIAPIKTEYQRWYNQVNIVSCNVNPRFTIPYIDTITLWVFVILFLVLFAVF